MKILYVVTKSSWGGAQRHVYDLATSFKMRGHEVMVALGGEGPLKRKLEEKGVYTFPIHSMERDVSIAKDWESFKAVYSIIKSKKPDIVHLHSPKAAGLGALAARIAGTKKIITTVHGWTFNEERSLPQKVSIMFISWVTGLMSHRTITISQKDFDQAGLFPKLKEKTTLIPLGIGIPVFLSIAGAKQELSKITGVNIDKRIVIGTIAELHANKNLPMLIKAIKNVSHAHPTVLTIVMGEGEQRKELEQMIKDEKLEDNVKLVGHVQDASEYLKAVSVFTLSSNKEGLPYCIMEAGSASLPVIATSVGGIPDIIEDMKSGILIQPKKWSELAHAISFMIEHPEERRRYGNALRERIVEKFSLEKMIAEIEKEYSL